MKLRWNGGPSAGVSAVGCRAGDVGAVGLGARPEDRRPPDLLFCAWLAWSRFRVVIPVWDKTLPTVIACLDRSMRLLGGVPTYCADGQRTHRVERAHRRDRRPAPVDRRRSATTTGSRSRRACRPTRRRRAVSKHGPDRQGRSGADRHEPARRIRVVRRARGGLRGVHGRGQRS